MTPQPVSPVEPRSLPGSGQTISGAPYSPPQTQLRRWVPITREYTDYQRLLRGEENVNIDIIPEGIVLTLRDIHFVADSDEILPSESGRLDAIAAALREISPNHRILVEVHTAATDRPPGEMDLSFMRARRLVNTLETRGIKSSRLFFRAWGDTRPIASNSTEEGRQLNRRVEIIILNENADMP